MGQAGSCYDSAASGQAQALGIGPVTNMASSGPLRNLTENPELRFTPSGVPMARFTVAVNPRVFDESSGEWRDGEPSFCNCTAWRQLAENTAQSPA